TVTNYAWGGATSGSVNNNNQALGLPGQAQEMQVLLASGRHFGISDLIDITTASPGGGNDTGAAAYGVGISTTQGVSNLAGYVQTYMSLGGRNFILTNTSNLALLQTALVPYANAGARIFLFDEATLANNVAANPKLYGFTVTGEYCRNYGGSGGTCASPNSGSSPSTATIIAEDQYTSIYQHPTVAFAALIAAYETNQVLAPATIAAQSELAQINAGAFSASLFNRLDSYRSGNASGATSASSPNVPISLFAEGSYQSGKRGDQLFSFGYDYHIASSTVGGEYRLNPNVVVGLAVNYSMPHATLNQSMGHIDADSYQFAGFGSVNYANWFADVVAGYGFNEYKLDRPGVLNTIRGNVHGSDALVGAKGGYLFNVAPVKLGPIAGINYTTAALDSYTEQAEYLLTQMVGKHTTEMVTGQIGGQIRLSEPFGAAKIDPYVNLTAEHEFLGGDQSIVTTQASTPLLSVTTPVAGRGDTTYGKVGGGISASLAEGLSAQVNGATTFSRKGGDDYGVNAGLKYRF
ncbi:MAG TPA: autotransporter domain-containing protein, partial [Telmatospirillum sp.]|nr:autotransporter domain-containing protein [Telmatospirillum sp.]